MIAQVFLSVTVILYSFLTEYMQAEPVEMNRFRLWALHPLLGKAGLSRLNFCKCWCWHS
jgi:hypothetical protein